LRRAERVRLAVDSVEVDVDEAHLHRGQGVLERLAIIAVVAIRGEPLFLGTPIGVLLGMPDVLPTESEAS
jgi:hypothetical protein